MALHLPRLVGIVLSPDKTFGELKNDPSWLNAFVALSIGKMVADWLRSRIELRAIEATAAQALDSEGAGKVVEFLAAASLLSISLTPVVVLLKWLAAAGVLYWLLVLVKEDIRFKPILSLAAHCWVVTLLGRYCNVLILYLKGPEAVSGLADLNVVLGLDFLARDSANVILRAFLANITVFTVWYVYLISAGLSRIACVSRRQGVMASVFLWTQVTGWKALLTTFGS
jgi:formate/nitrite transporter FocA (FNT family)